MNKRWERNRGVWNDPIAFCLNIWKDRVAIKLVNDVDKVDLDKVDKCQELNFGHVI